MSDDRACSMTKRTNRGGARAGAGRPALDPALRRSRVVALRCTEIEYEYVAAAAAAAGYDDVSAWLRAVALSSLGWAVSGPDSDSDA